MEAQSSDRKKYYQKTLQKHGESPKSLQWASYRAAAIRYRILVENLSPDNKSILDAGCGMGDLLPYLYTKTVNFEYLGVDVTDSFIEIAKKRYAGHNFEVLNPFEDVFNKKFDIVISSGVMNSNSAQWLEERQAMITKLYSLTKEVLVFNMAGSASPVMKEKNVVYANSEDILHFCLSLSKKVVLYNHYHPKDFTIAIYR